MDTSRATQLTLVLGGFFGKDVALERLTALDGATRADDETLLRTALGFHLWHNNSILFDDAGRFLTETLENPEPLIWDSLHYHRNGKSLAPLRFKIISSSVR
jgi:hypothetical protein